MAPCAIALHQLLDICHSYSVNSGLNFTPLKSFCFAVTLRRYSLLLPLLYITLPLSYVNFVEYLRFTVTRAHKDELLRQMRTLYGRSQRLLRIFHGGSEFGRSFCG